MVLTTHFLNLILKNPVAVGAGTFGYGEEISEFMDVSQLGALVVKGTSFEPWSGNPPPRICETPAGMLNSIGLQNEGLEYFIDHTMPKLRRLNVPVIVGVFDKTAENYAKIALRLDKVPGIAALELNLSCPNVKKGGQTFCSTPHLMREVIQRVKKATKLPILAKLSPTVTDIVAIAHAAVEEGANGLTLINTVVGMSIDIATKRPRTHTNVGGLSGPAIHPIAIANIWKVRRALQNIPILGIGGIHDVETAIETLLAGANVIGIGTANFYNPTICLEIIQGLEDYCTKNSILSVSALTGTVKDF